jgi:hypothetical protein
MTAMRLILACGCAVLVVGCAARLSSAPQSLVFLTRGECVNADRMRANLDAALRSLDQPTDYPLIDANTLPESDPRGGYGTPTVLVKGTDLFGMSEPPTPHPPPT